MRIKIREIIITNEFKKIESIKEVRSIYGVGDSIGNPKYFGLKAAKEAVEEVIDNDPYISYVHTYKSNCVELKACKRHSDLLYKANKELDRLTDTLQNIINNQILEFKAIEIELLEANNLNDNLRKHKSSDRMELLLDLIDDLGLIDRKGELKSLGDVIPLITSYMRTSI